MENISQLQTYCIQSSKYEDGGRKQLLASRAVELANQLWPCNGFVAGADEKTERKFMKRVGKETGNRVADKMKAEAPEPIRFLIEGMLLSLLINAIISFVIEKILEAIYNKLITKANMVAMGGCCGEPI